MKSKWSSCVQVPPPLLTKNASNMIKGIAVLMMLAHHLWGFPSRVSDLSLASPFVQIGESFKICVSIFMFLSGYGLYVTWKKRSCLNVSKRVWNTYKRFWQVFFVVVPIGILCHGIFFRWDEFIGNMLCLEYDYNHEWWFLGTYIELLVVLSWILRLESVKAFPWLIVVSAVALRASAEMLFAHLGGAFCHLFNFGYYYPSFLLGVVFAKYAWYERLSQTYAGWKSVALCVAFVTLSVFIRKIFGATVMTSIMVPAVVYLFIVMLNRIGRLKCIFCEAGKHSMNMWLVHTFFCYYWLKDIFFSVTHNAFLAYLVLVVVSYLSSILIDVFWRLIKNGMGVLTGKF